MEINNATNKNADEKAWAFFRKLLNNDGKYFTIKIKGEPIEISGSNGGRYRLYPNGHVMRLDKGTPQIGRVLKPSSFADPDLLSTLFIWITQKEDELIKNWGCGNLNVFYKPAEGGQVNIPPPLMMSPIYTPHRPYQRHTYRSHRNKIYTLDETQSTLLKIVEISLISQILIFIICRIIPIEVEDQLYAFNTTFMIVIAFVLCMVIGIMEKRR
ncbi:MAG: hypothetical protein QW270_03870 [Candidatus Bathyarchaeia archaeon]